ncbi:hypothetical protein [Neobacillus soli]|uniref:hypothetical protein n=1 Tax=Neobacillus soli TaxID=220688 RepID=UPI001155DC9D|nr:hypothetical protein [Neobacillus soli]
MRHYPNESMIEGELLLQSEFVLYRVRFKIWFTSDLKTVIKPIEKKHSLSFLKHIENRIYKNRIDIICGNWDEIE